MRSLRELRVRKNMRDFPGNPVTVLPMEGGVSVPDQGTEIPACLK